MRSKRVRGTLPGKGVRGVRPYVTHDATIPVTCFHGQNHALACTLGLFDSSRPLSKQIQAHYIQHQHKCVGCERLASDYLLEFMTFTSHVVGFCDTPRCTR